MFQNVEEEVAACIWPWYIYLAARSFAFHVCMVDIGRPVSPKANLAARFTASMASDRHTNDAETLMTLLESLLTMKRSSIASKLKPAPAERSLAPKSGCFLFVHLSTLAFETRLISANVKSGLINPPLLINPSRARNFRQY